MPLKKEVDFGKTSTDYAKYRAGFPQSFFDRLAAQKLVKPAENGAPPARVLDLGTGTGTIARKLAGAGFDVCGLDIAQNQLDAAAKMAEAEGVSVRFIPGTAEKTGQPDGSFDYVTAGQCWHWFDPAAALAETKRVLAPGGRLVLAYFDWVDDCPPVQEMYRLRAKYNPSWNVAGVWPFGSYPTGPGSMTFEGMKSVGAFDYTEDVFYTHEGWRGRMRSYSGIGGSLPAAAVEAFDAEFAAVLKDKLPQEPLAVPHRLWAEAFALKE
jgi:SAM-dependent methyltransferase